MLHRKITQSAAQWHKAIHIHAIPTYLVDLEWTSIVLLSADCAEFVIESASSRMTILNGGAGEPSGFVVLTAVPANVFTFCLTTLIPRSSDAFNSRTRSLNE